MEAGKRPVAKAADANLSVCLAETGVPGATSLNSVSFYTNDFETTTTGFDLVATWALDWGGAGSGDLTFAHNWTETEVDSAGQEVDRNRVVDLENFNPKNRSILTYQHFIGNLRLLGRVSYYDEWVNADFTDDPTPVGPNGTGYTISCVIRDDDCYDSEVLFDVEAAYSFGDNWSLIVGAMNLGDNFGPFDKENLNSDSGAFDLDEIGSGNTYAQSTPFGQDGGFWYVRVRADFE